MILPNTSCPLEVAEVNCAVDAGGEPRAGHEVSQSGPRLIKKCFGTVVADGAQPLALNKPTASYITIIGRQFPQRTTLSVCVQQTGHENGVHVETSGWRFKGGIGVLILSHRDGLNRSWLALSS